MIKRQLEDVIPGRIGSGKAIIVLGPRQTGKTTLLQGIASGIGRHLLIDCDDSFIRSHLEGINTEGIRQLIGDHKLIFIDEAQRVKDIGLTLKIITDQFREVQLLVSGSSSLDLMSETREPLTGRKWEYMLYPISWRELEDHSGYITAMQQLESRIIYGMYPDVVNNPGHEKEILRQLSGIYLYKDILSVNGLRKPELLEKLLKAIALQLGNEVSYNELSRLLQVDKKTISNYLDLLEKAFIIFRLQPFSRNLRTEISTTRKIYFYDTGIRNALLANFNPLNLRQDTGALWENFLVAERMKTIEYTSIWTNTYFWRTSQQQEVDYLEERDGNLFAYEFKWSPSRKERIPRVFTNTYPSSSGMVVTRDNFREFLDSS